MPAHTTFPERSAVATGGKLHLCLLDPHGNLRGANHAFEPGALKPLPVLIRDAYGVLPHPDMPDGVYSRMEGRLRDFPASAGYYLCLTEDGTVFWIAVSIYKTPHGRVVCHMPVSSPQLEQFATFFAHLKQAEREDLDPEDSAKQLISLMLSEGVTDYRTLATAIIIEEIGGRDAGRNRRQYQDLRMLQKMLQTLRDIDHAAKTIDRISDRSRLIPYQLKLQATRLEGRHGPLCVVADNHQLLTDKLLDVTAHLQRASATELDAVTDAIAYVAQSNHAAELLECSTVSLCGTPEAEASARADLQFVIEDCQHQIQVLLANIDKAILTLNGICSDMRRAVSAMEITSMMCKIERGRLNEQAGGLEGIEEQLCLVHTSLNDWMAKIDNGANTALARAERIKQGGAIAA